ncbi:hypothetical protein [Peribacillus glennii]|uniref:Uncharacterized protein n=1 Tax=Peribacillus glennii TaxID=2303991 RepID=A0A372L7H7_9BACI|nr:hypothetical protein [Peribacillus glennii]RFU60862.1 hypothetical protein D0466_19980 [Peribacillus glennii]
MNSLDALLQTFISKGKIYSSKLAAHFDWQQGGKHLIVATSILDKRYILLKENEKIDLPMHGNNLYFYEVVKGSPHNQTFYKGIINHTEEADWLGEFSFILTTGQFNTKKDRELLEANYSNFIFLHDQPAESINFLKLDFRLGFNNQNGQWGFSWVEHDHPFYKSDGLLCPRKNCMTEGLGVIWDRKEEVDLIMKNILLITRKFGEKSYFQNYPTAKKFMDDFLGIMKKIADKTMKPKEMNDWSSFALSKFSIT